MIRFFIIVFLTITLITIITCSSGDRSGFYQRCLERCSLNNCTEGRIKFKSNVNQGIILKILQWNCKDECQYECMWNTVEAYQKRNMDVPQFYGKWPFVRFLGLQEPASVFFSILNFAVHSWMIIVFRKTIPKNTPLFWLWHSFAIVSMHAWFWSAVFHARDIRITEVMDYICAFSIIMYSFFCMGIRFLYWQSMKIKVIFSITTAIIFLNHSAYLNTEGFSYAYNMQVNIFFGFLTAVFWYLWCLLYRSQQPYVWKCAVFITFTALATLLEIIDHAPFLWVFDAHALWHLSTVPLMPMFYSFIMDDCNYLRKYVKLKEIKDDKTYKLS